MIFGIFCGLMAAITQSMSYFSTRFYVQKRGRSANWQLLVLGHVWMGIFAVIQLAIVWPWRGGEIAWGAMAIPMMGTSILNLCGQLGLAYALKHAEATRVSPLMTSKLIMTASISAVFGQPVGAVSAGITWMQWVGVALCVFAGLSINFSGGRMKKKAIAGIAFSATSFAFSDWMINLTIKALMNPQIDHARASLLTECFTYIVMGVIAVSFLRPMGSKVKKDWVEAAPFAITWFVAMIFLFIAFSTVGLLLGSILQCTRGFIAILIGVAIIKLGHHQIEPHAPRRVMIRRLCAGLLMFAGITLYVIRDPAKLTMGWRSAPATQVGQAQRSLCPPTPITNCSVPDMSAKRV